MTQQEKRFNVNAPQDQDLLDAMAEAYQPQIVRERQLLDAVVEAQVDDEEVDLAKMMAMLNDDDMQPDVDSRTKRVVRFCRICGVGSCGVHPIEIEVD